MSDELYLYITGGKSCISTAPPVWNKEKQCLWHAKGSRVLSIEGTRGMEILLSNCIHGLNLNSSYLTINQLTIYTTTLESLEECCLTSSAEDKRNILFRNRKK